MRQGFALDNAQQLRTWQSARNACAREANTTIATIPRRGKCRVKLTTGIEMQQFFSSNVSGVSSLHRCVCFLPTSYATRIYMAKTTPAFGCHFCLPVSHTLWTTSISRTRRYTKHIVFVPSSHPLFSVFLSARVSKRMPPPQLAGPSRPVCSCRVPLLPLRRESVCHTAPYAPGDACCLVLARRPHRLDVCMSHIDRL